MNCFLQQNFSSVREWRSATLVKTDNATVCCTVHLKVAKKVGVPTAQQKMVTMWDDGIWSVVCHIISGQCNIVCHSQEPSCA